MEEMNKVNEVAMENLELLNYAEKELNTKLREKGRITSSEIYEILGVSLYNL